MLKASSNRPHPFVLLFLSLLTLIQPSFAFFPTTWRQNWFGNNGVSHELQTQRAFEQLAAKYYPETKELTRSMIAAREALALANVLVDDDYNHSAYHCDGENFEGAQQRLIELKNKTIQALKKNDPDDARKQLGSALHTIQDFYSHSNWVEMGNTKPHPDLGRGRPIAHAAFDNATCTNCGPTNQKDDAGCPLCVNKKSLGLELNVLTSGYAFDEDSPAQKVNIPETKCHHGGYIDSPQGSVMGFFTGMTVGTSMPGINKDSLNCGFSPHNYLHHEAVNVSIAATVQFIDDIKQNVTDTELNSLFGVGRTFSFFIDISAVLKSVQDFFIYRTIKTAATGSKNEQANAYQVTAYNGSTVHVTASLDLPKFKDAVTRVADEPRPRNQTSCNGVPLINILNHIKSLQDGSSLFLMAGGIATDDDIGAEIVSTAYAKDVTIHSFQFPNDCRDSRIHQKINGAFNVKSLYDGFATATGGSITTVDEQTLSMGADADLGKRSALDSSAGRQDSARILTVDTRIANMSMPMLRTFQHNFTFPVDSSMSQLKVSLLARNASLTLIDPKGVDVQPSFWSSSVLKTSMPGGNFFTLDSPAVGRWTAVVNTSSTFALDVYGGTLLRMAGFDIMRWAGRSGHQGFFPQVTQPVARTNITAIGNLEGGFKNATWDLRTLAGALARSDFLFPGSNEVGQAPRKSFFGTLKLDRGQYVVYVTGHNAKGEEFQRAWNRTISPI